MRERHGRVSWELRGAAAIGLALLLIALVAFAVITLSLVLLALAIVCMAALALAGLGHRLWTALRQRLPIRPAPPTVEIIDRAARPEHIYLDGVREFDALTTLLLSVSPAKRHTWRAGRLLHRAETRIERLRARLEQAERAVAAGYGTTRIQPGLWELMAAAQALERYLDALMGFPRSRHPTEQLAEAEAIRQQGEALDRRRDALLLRLRRTDLRDARA